MIDNSFSIIANLTHEQKEKVHSYYINLYKSKPHEWKEGLRNTDNIPCMYYLIFIM